MHSYQPLTRLVVDRKLYHNDREIDHELYEGEVEMTQQQQDAYKAIIGDGLATVTVSRTLSHKNYGSGGDVFVSVSLKCDQSSDGLATAIEYAKQLAEDRAWNHLDQLRHQLVQRGIVQS